LSSQQAIEFVATRIAQGLSIAHICEAMTQHCLAKDAIAGIGCDNMTVVICGLCHGKSELEWREQITKRVAETVKDDDAVATAPTAGAK
jgi:protein phosphatase PTC2/3